MNKVAQNKKIIMAAKVMAKAVREEVEDILKDTEECVKKYIPARYVKASLKEVEKQLVANGIDAEFDKTIEKSAFKATASQKPTGREIRETLNKVAAATIAEVEEALKETEDAANVIAKKLGKTANNVDEVEEELLEEETLEDEEEIVEEEIVDEEIVEEEIVEEETDEEM